MKVDNCILCKRDDAEVIFRTELWRVLLVNDPNLPGFCRVVLNEHIIEMTDLPGTRRSALMDVVWLIEQTIRDVMHPDKINIASLGNMVPHIHWHIIPRYKDDMTFPDSIWSLPHRTINAETLAKRQQKIATLCNLLKTRLKERYGKPSDSIDYD